MTVHNFIYGLAFAVLIGLGTWTLRGVTELEMQTARLERDNQWVKTILSEMSRRIDQQK